MQAINRNIIIELHKYRLLFPVLKETSYWTQGAGWKIAHSQHSVSSLAKQSLDPLASIQSTATV